MKQRMENDRALQARAQLVEDLEKKAAVKIMLDPPRYTVAVGQDDPVRGSKTAAVTIIEFSEYQCPFCARVNPTLDRIRQTYGDKVKIVFKDFPLPNHPQAPKAAEAAHCAGEQGKYWEMHDVMFANQRALEVPALKQSAAGLGLDMAKFNQCLDSGQYSVESRGGSGARRQARRQLHADAVHQRPSRDRRATIRGVQGRHRRRTQATVRGTLAGGTSCREGTS